MKLKDLPQPIRKLAEKRIREQGNEPDGEKDLTANQPIGGFYWDKSIEGNVFWHEIYLDNFTPFYERYPQPKQYTLEQLREEKIAVLVENEEEAKELGIELYEGYKPLYWSKSKDRSTGVRDDWSWDSFTYWSVRGFTLINFSQVLLPEAKQEAGVGTNYTPPTNLHYKQTTIEPITVIQDWKLSFCLGNVIKYIGRAEHKGNKLADLEKAADYLRIEIESLKTK
jgi:Protein of unknwon function (DUF3310)